jgi:hypothetical protein
LQEPGKDHFHEIAGADFERARRGGGPGSNTGTEAWQKVVDWRPRSAVFIGMNL